MERSNEDLSWIVTGNSQKNKFFRTLTDAEKYLQQAYLQPTTGNWKKTGQGNCKGTHSSGRDVIVGGHKCVTVQHAKCGLA
jgi:hypothetical protein